MTTATIPDATRAYIERIVAAAPPLSEQQKAKLRPLLNPGAGIAPIPRMGDVPQPLPPKERTALYRHYDSEGALLYVGITKHPETRRSTHARRSAWAEFAMRESVEWFDDRAAALAAESAAITDERPLFNSAGADMTERNPRLVDYIIRRRAFHLLTVAATAKGSR